MRIVKVWKNDYPWDVRVEKICKTLIDDGHDVHLLCSNTKDQKRNENINGLQIHRLPAVGNKIIDRISSVQAFFNPLWVFELLRVVRTENIDVIMIRDLPLVLTGILAGWLYNIPVIFDMSENYPAMWEDIVDRRGINAYNYLLKNPAVAEIMEKLVVKRVAHTIVVIEESKERILRLGAPEEKVSIVGNTPDIRSADDGSESELNENLFKDKLKIVYTGFVDSGRGLDTVIRALPALREKVENVLLIIVGDGSYLTDLKNLAKEKKVEDQILFTGWVDHSKVKYYIRNGDICLIPHTISKQMNTTIPNKLFDYMLYSKPVIVSDARPLKRIVEENNCGVFFESKNEKDLTEKVLELKDPSVRHKMGENGYDAVRSIYNWERDSEELRKVFERFENRRFN